MKIKSVLCRPARLVAMATAWGALLGLGGSAVAAVTLPPPATISPGSLPSVPSCSAGSTVYSASVAPIVTGGVWVLPGDSVEAVGTALGCDSISGPINILTYPGAAPQWGVRPQGGSDTWSPTVGSVIDTGDVVTTTRVFGPFSAADEGSSIRYGIPVPVVFPSNDPASAVSSLVIHIAQPNISITTQACIYSGQADAATRCVASDDSAWTADVSVAGSSQVYWRFVATNTGNVDLQNVNISQSLFSGGATGSNSSCLGQVGGGTLTVGSAASLICVTSSPASAASPVINTATVTADINPSATAGSVPGSQTSLAARFMPGAIAGSGSAQVRVPGSGFVTPGSPVSVPTLSQWGLILLAGMLGLFVVGTLPRRLKA